VLYFPVLLQNVIPGQGFQNFVSRNIINQASPIYMLVFGLLVVFFAYFYTAIAFNPVDTGRQHPQAGRVHPGIRPGPPTAIPERHPRAHHAAGSIYLATIALIPSVVLAIWGDQPVPIRRDLDPHHGGRRLETMKQLESQLLMRHYEGFLK
jgi:preprotein translocase subunit SecY